MRLLISISILMVNYYVMAQPHSYNPRGVGGGGAMFSLSINPQDADEYYASCDMGELFHTYDFGLNYDQVHYAQIRGGHDSKVCYTTTQGLLYTLSYANDLVLPMKSLDGGKTWATLAGNPDPSEWSYSINVDYQNGQRVILSYYGQIYFSNNGGTSFTQIHTATNGGSGVIVGGVFFDGNNIFIGTNDGLLYSSNAGGTWSNLGSLGIAAGQQLWSMAGAKENGVTRLFCITGDPANMYVGVRGSDYYGFAKGIYAMDFGTTNWVSKINPGINLASDFPMFVGMAKNNINTIYLAGSNAISEPTVFKTTNGGNTWANTFTTSSNQNIATGWSGQGGDRGWSYGECAFGIEVAHFDASRVIFGDFGFVHATKDGGSTWQQAYTSIDDQHPMGATTPPMQAYSSCGIENTSCWQMMWVDQNNIWSCFSDIRGMRSTDKGEMWSYNYTGHTANTMYRIVKLPNGTLLVATSNVHDIYQSTYLTDARLDVNDANGKIIYSTNNGLTWQLLKLFSHPVFWIAIDPNNANRAYASVIHYSNNAGVGGIYRTDNLNNLSGATWTLLPNPPRTEKHPASLVVLNDVTLVCTYSGRRNASGAFTASSGVYTYNPTTNTFTDRSHIGMQYWTKDIVIDPNDALQNTWYACVFSGWGGPPNGLGGLYKTTNRGVTWTKLTASQIDRATSCTFNPLNPNQIYITTESQGLWMSSNINQSTPTFTQVANYPFQQPERIFFNPYDATEMWITNFGNGMKKSILPTSGCKTVTNFNNTGAGSLAYAIDCAASGDTILFASTMTNDTIRLTNNLYLNKNLTFLNQNAMKVKIKTSAYAFINIEKDIQVKFENFVFTANATAISIMNKGNLSLKNVLADNGLPSTKVLHRKGSTMIVDGVVDIR
jgi:photosystem II stability/assembly factor-like uncharacterized protein